MAAQIPIKGDADANERALAKVRADKLREVRDGHDGTWVAHPGLVPVAREAFDAHMAGANQLERLREDVNVGAADLLRVPEGTRTDAGLRHNVRVGVQYIDAWLRGNGCVPLYHLMEDAATAEISRAQVWQWIHYRVRLDDTGEAVTPALLDRVLADEIGDRFPRASALFKRLATGETLEDFLTTAAYADLDGEAATNLD
jgi:malate synthase